MTTIHDDHLPTDGTGDGVEKSAVEARQGVKTYRIRWVLAGSLVLSIVALSAAWMSYAAFQHPHEPTTETRPSTTAPQSTY